MKRRTTKWNAKAWDRRWQAFSSMLDEIYDVDIPRKNTRRLSLAFKRYRAAERAYRGRA